MTTLGPTICSAGATSPRNTGYTPWTNPGNVAAEDATFATCAPGSAPYWTDYLIGSGMSWGTLVGITLTNIKVELKGKVGSGTKTGGSDFDMLLCAAGVPLVARANAVTLTTTNGWVTVIDNSPAALSFVDPDLTTFTNAVMSGTDGYALRGYGGAGTTWSIDAIQVTLTYTTGGANTAPTIISAPVATYAAYTRTGPNNTWGVTFTAHDPEQAGANQLTYSIRTSATYGAGTEIATGTCTSDVSKTVTGLAYNITGLADGSNTLYLHISDGTDHTVTASSFTLLRDDTAPTAATAISTTPDPVV